MLALARGHDEGEKMAAPAGWYDAGVPGRERWWDGTQWTAHERDAARADAGASPVADSGHVASPGRGDSAAGEGFAAPGPAVAPGAAQVDPAPGQVVAPGQIVAPGQVAPVPGQAFTAPGSAATAPGQAAAVPGHVVAAPGAHPAAGGYPAQGAPLGWYPVPGTADVRWWDGTQWAPYRFRDGKPKTDAFAIEPPVVGILFLMLGLLQFANYALAQNGATAAAPVFFIAAGAVWIFCGIHAYRVRALPAPQSAPVDAPVLRPMPGDVEGPGAGWYPMSGQVTRWWTGARWSWYIGMKFGARPGFAGPRGYLVSIIATWVVAAVGAIGVLIGIIGLVVGGAASPFLGIFGFVFGVIFLGLAALLFGITRSRRYAMLLPTTPPPIR